MERALARRPGPRRLPGAGAPTRESPRLVSGSPSLPERMCKRKATPPFRIGLCPGHAAGQTPETFSRRWWPPRPAPRAPAAKRRQEATSRGTFPRGCQGPSPVQFRRGGRAAGLTRRGVGGVTPDRVGIRRPRGRRGPNPDLLCRSHLQSHDRRERWRRVPSACPAGGAPEEQGLPGIAPSSPRPASWWPGGGRRVEVPIREGFPGRGLAGRVESRLQREIESKIPK